MRKLCPILLSVPLMFGLSACKRPTAVMQAEAPPVTDLPEKISFNTHIQPILSEKCYHCHGPDSGTREPKEEPLRLDREKLAFTPRENGQPVILKGDPAKSLLMKRIHTKDPDEVMPPPESHKELTPTETALLERWIEQGAVYEDHWAFIAPKRPPLPGMADGKSGGNPVDAFVESKLKEHRLTLSPAEEPRALVRRLSLDTTGLLPDPAEVEAFAANPTEAAYSALVDKFLASPTAAEHRARYWLDYARYSDTNGLHFDNYRSIWPYRDYVIRSFGENKPFDQFVREQLAGDLLPKSTVDQLVATGYVRCAVTTNEGGTIREEVETNLSRDRVEAFGAAFLGLTVGCATCHDHKFDPTTQKDFYSLTAFFNNIDGKAWDENIHNSRPVLNLPKPDQRPAFDAAVAKRSAAQANYEARRSSAADRFKTWLAGGNKPLPVAPDALEVRLKLDEGTGEVVRNSAPKARTASYTADTNPLNWGEDSWLWPSARFDMSTRLALPDEGDFEADQAFSAGTWTMLRLSPSNSITGDGSLLSRMGGPERNAHRGWDLFVEGNKLIVHIVSHWPESAIRVETVGIPRGEWIHAGFTYDGSSKAAGVQIYLNGKPVPMTVSNDTLQPGQTIRTDAPLQLGRRENLQLLRQCRFQDLRVYHRALSKEEFVRLSFEDPASEIVAASADPSTWSADQRFVVLDRFFLGEKDADAIKLAAEVNAANAEIEALGKDGTPTLIAAEKSTPASASILTRGNYASRKERVFPATPAFLPPLPASLPANRLGLAEWLFLPENPLFSRVTVNRAWQEVFGTGLVETSDDFGIMGARPSNPELLDWLSVEFRESKWDLRHLYKLLLTSRTYRQSQQITPEKLAADPANRLLSRGPRFRLDAEVLRDVALQSSALLNPEVGGPSVKSYQTPGIWEAVSMPESNTLHYKQDKGSALYRRSMYSFWKRFAPPPSLETFDAQARETVCIRRARTNTPLQALVTMNDPQFFEAARKLAERAIKSGTDPAARLDFMARLLIARPLDAKEKTALTKSLARFSDYYKGHPQDAKDLLTNGESPADPSLDPVELATWSVTANQLLNLDEFLVK